MPGLSIHETQTIVAIDGIIDSFFETSIADSAKISPYYEQLWCDMHRWISSGGKRLRPRMVMRAYAAFGGKKPVAIMPVAASQELLHASLLVHDDIIDRDYVRYGVDNIAGRYAREYYQHVLDESDRLHYAHSAALLAGDLLLSASYQMVLAGDIDSVQQVAVQKIHGRSIFDVAGGELIDTETAFRLPGEIDAQTVATYKTASYTFVAPLTIGAVLAGAPEKSLVTLREFARNLGIAYQLRDDVIGVFGDEAVIGKTTTGDIREGKRTFMVEQFYEHAAAEEKAHFDLFFGDNGISRSEVESIKTLLVSSGALQRTEETIVRYAEAAEAALDELKLPEKGYETLFELIGIVTRRDK